MRFLVLSVILFEVFCQIRSEDLFLENLKQQFADVPKDVKLFDFLQNENNLRGILGLHNDMCAQMNAVGDLKANHRARRQAAESSDSTTTASSGATDNAIVTNATTVSASDDTTGPTVADAKVTDAPTSGSPSQKRRRRDATDSSASTTNSTATANQTNDKDEQQNLNDQQPPSDDQGGEPSQGGPAGGENQEAEMQAAGVAYFKNIILTVLRYILNCLMTYINIFY